MLTQIRRQKQKKLVEELAKIKAQNSLFMDLMEKFSVLIAMEMTLAHQKANSDSNIRAFLLINIYQESLLIFE